IQKTVYNLKIVVSSMCKSPATVAIAQGKNIFNIGLTMIVYLYIALFVLFYSGVVKCQKIGIALSSRSHKYVASANAALATRAVEQHFYSIFAERLTRNTF